MSAYHLIGSASTLEDLADMLKARWFRSVVEFIPVSDRPRIWAVNSGKGRISTLRVVRKGARYRLESYI